MQKRYLQIHLKISSFIFLGTFSTFKQESSVIFLIMIKSFKKIVLFFKFLTYIILKSKGLINFFFIKIIF